MSVKSNTGVTKLSTLLHSGCRALQLTIDPAQEKMLFDYLALLKEWNQQINLTAISDPEKMITHHLLDSLSISPWLQGERLIDIGTGAGFPGLPLAILHPERQFFLLDSHTKKTQFLLYASHQLQLKNITVVTSRAEHFKVLPLFDTIMTRAVAKLSDILLHTAHLGHANTVWLLMQGQLPTDELLQIKAPFRLRTVEQLQVPHLNAMRHLVIVER